MEPKKKKIDPRRSHLRHAEDEERKEDKKKIDPKRLSQKCGPEHTLNGYTKVYDSKKKTFYMKRAPKCPICGAPMTARTGPYSTFLGCTRYPKCKGTRQI